MITAEVLSGTPKELPFTLFLLTQFFARLCTLGMVEAMWNLMGACVA